MNKVRVTVIGGKPHKINPAHYNGHREKSQWEPRDPRREFRLFDLADGYDWTVNGEDYWSFDCDGKRPKPLGRSPLGIVCRWARYRRDRPRQPWHGYPITFTRQGEQAPPRKVLDQWFNEQKALSRAWRKKIVCRQV